MNIMMITIIDIQHQNNSQSPQNISERSVRRAKSPGDSKRRRRHSRTRTLVGSATPEMLRHCQSTAVYIIRCWWCWAQTADFIEL